MQFFNNFYKSYVELFVITTKLFFRTFFFMNFGGNSMEMLYNQMIHFTKKPPFTVNDNTV